MKIHSPSNIKPIEMALTAYVLITSLILFIAHKSLSNEGAHIAFRILVLAAIGLFMRFDTGQNRFISFVRLVAPLLLLGYFYTETDYLNNLIFKENLDPLIWAWEQSLFGGQPAEVFSQAIASNYFAEIMYFGYFSYYLLIVGVPLIIYFKFGMERAEKVVFIIVNSFLIYYLVFIVFPVAGPQFYVAGSIKSLPQGYIFGGLIRFIQDYGEAPTAAFPSSHVSICLMLVWICMQHIRNLLPFVIPIALLLIFSTVYIKAHYAVDVIAAFLITPLIYIVSYHIFNQLNLKIKQHDTIHT